MFCVYSAKDLTTGTKGTSLILRENAIKFYLKKRLKKYLI